MESKDKIDLALRAAIIAHSVLAMVATSGKFHAKIVMQDVVEKVVELDKRVKSLPED